MKLLQRSGLALAGAVFALPVLAQEFLCTSARTIDLDREERVTVDKREAAVRVHVDAAKARMIRTIPGSTRAVTSAYDLRVENSAAQGKPVALHASEVGEAGSCSTSWVLDLEFLTLKAATLCSGHTGPSLQVFRCSRAGR